MVDGVGVIAFEPGVSEELGYFICTWRVGEGVGLLLLYLEQMVGVEVTPFVPGAVDGGGFTPFVAGKEAGEVIPFLYLERGEGGVTPFQPGKDVNQ